MSPQLKDEERTAWYRKKGIFILSELGWLQKTLKRWTVTDPGKKQGGVQSEDQKSGIPFVRWPESIIQSKYLNETIDQTNEATQEKKEATEESNKEMDFREKFEPRHRTADGHFVHSKAEMLIDN